MISLLGLCLPALGVEPPPGSRRPPSALVLPGVKRIPGYTRVREYQPPTPSPAAGAAETASDPTILPSDVRVVEVVAKDEVLVLTRPALAPLLGAAVSGARLAVKGTFEASSAAGCPTRLWYALDPAGFVCSRGVRPTSGPPSDTPVVRAAEDASVPFRYVMVGVPEGTTVPLWASLESARADEEPERQLERGDTVAIARTIKIRGETHYISVEGKVLPVRGTNSIDARISAWQGEPLDPSSVLPFGWITPEMASVYSTPMPRGKPIERITRRTRVAILEESISGRSRMLRVGEARWVRADDVNEVRRITRPEGMTLTAQWIDVDLGEQVLVAYQGEQPVYATLISSGRAIPTPRGNYPIWAKVSSISMKSQPYEDKAYFVNKVPWALFFQAHNAIHGAYWHDRFGVSKSHGCVNVAPRDAAYLFDWLQLPLPHGWTGFRPPDLLRSPTVHVRNSRKRVELVQERPIGPPDKELEALKLQEAEARRAAAQDDAAANETGGSIAPAGIKP